MALQLRDLAVLQLGHLTQIPCTAGILQVNPGLLQLALDLLGAVQSRLFSVPDFLKVGVFALNVADNGRQLFQPLLRGCVGFLFQGFPLNLELNQPALQTIQSLRLGVHFHTDLAGRFIHQVNGLIRQLTIGNISMRQLGGRDDGAIRYLNPMVNLIALFQPTQDGDGIFLTGLADQHFLETALQCCVFFNIFPVLIQRGGADTVQLAPGQGRLQHVAGIHGTFGFTGAHHGVDLVNEQDDLAFLFRQLIKHCLQALLKLTPELGAGNQCAHVQRQYFLVFQAIGHLSVDDTLSQPLHNRGFTHTGLTDQHGVVLAPALQYLNGATDFIVATNHRVQLAGLGPLGKINGVL